MHGISVLLTQLFKVIVHIKAQLIMNHIVKFATTRLAK